MIDEDNWAPLIFSFNPIYLLSVVHFIVENLPSNLEKCSIINFYCKRRSTFNGRIVKLFKDAQVHVFCFHCINCYLFMGILNHIHAPLFLFWQHTNWNKDKCLLQFDVFQYSAALCVYCCEVPFSYHRNLINLSMSFCRSYKLWWPLRYERWWSEYTVWIGPSRNLQLQIRFQI